LVIEQHIQARVNNVEAGANPFPLSAEYADGLDQYREARNDPEECIEEERQTCERYPLRPRPKRIKRGA